MERAIHSYPKVLAIGHRYIQPLFEGSYHAEEKVDGSQISFGVIGGELHVRSKGQMLIVDAPEKMFAEGVVSIKNRADKLTPEWIYRGEYFKKPKHNTLPYNRIPEGHILIFDVETTPNNWLSHADKVIEAQRIGLECVPKIDFTFNGVDSIKEALQQTSCLGGVNLEGIIVKNYDQITPDGKFMAGKYVSESFKESHSKDWKSRNPGRRDIILMIIETLRTDARFKKAVQRLRDNGEWTESPKDIGNLLKILHQDIEAEDGEFIKQKLYEHFIKDIKRGTCAGFPEWYKDELVRGFDIARNSEWEFTNPIDWIMENK